MMRSAIPMRIIGVCAFVALVIGIGIVMRLAPETDGAYLQGDDSHGKIEAPSTQEPVLSPANFDWPQYRGAGAMSSQAGATFPITWSESEGIRWKAALPGRGSSSPTVVGNRVFVTAHTGYGMSPTQRGAKSELLFHLICKDRDTGATLWQRAIQGSMLTQRLNDTLLGHGFASHSPVCDGNMVYVFFGVSGVFAFDLDGELAWQQNVGIDSCFFGSSASLTIHENLLIVNASIESGKIYAFEKSTGKGVWKIEDVDRCYSMPVFGQAPDGSVEMIVSEEDTVHGFDPMTGKELWHCEGIRNYTVSSPMIVNGVCYCSGGVVRQMMAIRMGGRDDVTQTHKIWEVPFGGNVGALLVVNDTLFIADDSGILGSYDAKTGERLKRRRAGKKERVYSNLLLVDDKIFVPIQSGEILVLKANANMTEIAQSVVASDEGPLHSSLAANGDRAFIRTSRFLYCIAETGNPSVVIDDQTTSPIQDVIVPTARVDFVAATSRLAPYCYYLARDRDAVIQILLAPYKSVITEEQKKQFDFIFDENRLPFDELRKEQEQAHWDFMKGAIDREQLVAILDTVGKAAIAHSSKVRILVKNLFTDAQMEQHLKEAAAFRASQKRK